MASNNSYAPFLYLKDNSFTRNTAYFEGNALYIKGGKLNKKMTNNGSKSKNSLIQTEINGNIFEKNYGLNNALGAALSINGN